MKRLSLTAALLLCLFTLAACSQPAPQDPTGQTATVQPATTTTTQPEDEPDPEPQPDPEGPLSLLTGLPVPEERAKARPMAVMINNLKKATPSRGIGSADMYIEILAEGEINRIMAVFTDYAGLTSIGSVRSARDYFVDYAQGLDAVFIHYGGSPQAYTVLKQRKVPHLDGINGTVDSIMFYRDKDRRKTAGYEHSAFATGEGLVKALERFELRTTVDESAQPVFTFAESPAPAGAIDAPTLTAVYSKYISPVFAYDDENDVYLRSQYGEKHIDELTGEQLSVENVVVLFTEHERIKGDDALRIKVDTVGSGEGYYFSMGKGARIGWTKESVSSPLLLTDDQGNALPINPGKTWICILPPSAESSLLK